MVEAERVGQGAVLAIPAFEWVAHPTLEDGRSAPALRFDDPRVQALTIAAGITNQSLRAQMPGLFGQRYTPPKPATT